MSACCSKLSHASVVYYITPEISSHNVIVKAHTVSHQSSALRHMLAAALHAGQTDRRQQDKTKPGHRGRRTPSISCRLQQSVAVSFPFCGSWRGHDFCHFLLFCGALKVKLRHIQPTTPGAAAEQQRRERRRRRRRRGGKPFSCFT